MKKESVILYANQWAALSRLTDEQLGALFRAVFRWLNDEPLETDTWEQSLYVAFKFLTLQISVDSEKYLQKCRNNKRKWKQHEIQKNVKKTKPSRAPDNDEDDDEDEDKNEDEDVSLFVNKLKNMEGDEKEKDTEKMFQSFMGFWNNAIEQTGASLKRIRILTPKRREAIAAIRRQFSSDQAAQAIYNAMRSPFCNGRTKRRPVPVDFDWLMKPENFTRALEGSL